VIGVYYVGSGDLAPLTDDKFDAMAKSAFAQVGDQRGPALAGLLAYAAENMLTDTPIVHLTERHGVSSDVSWEPRPDRIVLGQTMTLARR
jgi:hypothetical protein